jgi:hypothetical protein
VSEMAVKITAVLSVRVANEECKGLRGLLDPTTRAFPIHTWLAGTKAREAWKHENRALTKKEQEKAPLRRPPKWQYGSTICVGYHRPTPREWATFTSWLPHCQHLGIVAAVPDVWLRLFQTMLSDLMRNLQESMLSGLAKNGKP